MESRLLKGALGLSALMLCGLTGCSDKANLENEKSPDAPAQTTKTSPASGSKKPGAGFQTRPVGSDTSLKETK